MSEKIQVLWDVALFCWGSSSEQSPCFICRDKQSKKSKFLSREYEGTAVLQNSRDYSPCDTVLHPKRLESAMLLSEPHSSNVRALLSDDQYSLSSIHEGMWKYMSDTFLLYTTIRNVNLTNFVKKNLTQKIIPVQQNKLVGE